MLAALGLVIPLGLAGAFSPVMLTEQTVLLAGPDGYRAGARFAAGVVAVLLVVVGSIMFFGRAISLPAEPRLDASLDLLLGLVLLALAVVVGRLGRGRDRRPARRGRRADGASASRRSRAAFPFGVFSMATNFTTLALIIPAAKEISTADADIAGRLALVGVLVVLAASAGVVARGAEQARSRARRAPPGRAPVADRAPRADGDRRAAHGDRPLPRRARHRGRDRLNPAGCLTVQQLLIDS